MDGHAILTQYPQLFLLSASLLWFPQPWTYSRCLSNPCLLVEPIQMAFIKFFPFLKCEDAMLRCPSIALLQSAGRSVSPFGKQRDPRNGFQMRSTDLLVGSDTVGFIANPPLNRCTESKYFTRSSSGANVILPARSNVRGPHALFLFFSFQ